MSLLPGQPRLLKYGDGELRTDLRLLELDDALLNEIINHGVVIKGGDDEEAVMCTSDRTYALKYVETSNTLLLVPPAASTAAGGESNGPEDDAMDADYTQLDVPLGAGLQTQLAEGRRAHQYAPIEIAATAKAHIELVEVAPRLEALGPLLRQAAYSGPEDEPSSSSGLFTFDQLLAKVQASASELRVALAELQAVQLGPHWRLVSPGHLGHLLEMLLLTAVQHGWHLDALPPGAAAEALAADGYDPRVVRHCLDVYGKAGSTGAGSKAAGEGSAEPMACDGPAGEESCQLDLEKVCVHYGCKVLAAAGRRGLPLADFLRQWLAEWERVTGEATLTNGQPAASAVAPTVELLVGEALVEAGGSSGQNIRAYSVRDLPRDPAARFATLFAERPRWEWRELEPFLKGLSVPGQSVAALLLKYARGSQITPDAPLIYCAR